MTVLPRTRSSLVLRLRDDRDGDAWRAFVDVYAPAVFAFARRQGLQDADAADVAQDVCRKVAAALRAGGYDAGRGAFRPWLFGVVRNELKMFWRTQGRHARGTGDTDFLRVLAELPEPAAEETWDLEVRRRLFSWACDRVRPTVAPATWQAFWMLAVEGSDGEAAAHATGLTAAAAYLAKSRVLAKLRQAVAGMEEP